MKKNDIKPSRKKVGMTQAYFPDKPKAKRKTDAKKKVLVKKSPHYIVWRDVSGKWNLLADFPTLKHAKEYARAYAAAHNCKVQVTD